ncbi:MAG: hypothetical protein ACW979_14345 [Candidatus Thorarchaeota archaeon]|jgi:hypothetical protein
MVDEAWIPAVYELAIPTDKVQMAGPYFDNVDDTDFQLMFRVPLPATKGNLKLHIDGIKVGVFDADTANNVLQYWVYGIAFDTNQSLFQDTQPIIAQELRTKRFPAIDVSKWESVMVRVWCAVTAAHDLNISSILVHCYYA